MAKDARARNQPLFSEDDLEARRPLFLEGISQYNDGYFFEAHETWEDLWYPSPAPYREFLQGIIQIAAAFVHLMRHEYPGTVRLLDAALERLAPYDAAFMGIDVDRLRREAARARDELAALGPAHFESWDRTRIPQIHLVAASRRIRRRA